jgi:hypothetical protein
MLISVAFSDVKELIDKGLTNKDKPEVAKVYFEQALDQIEDKDSKNYVKVNMYLGNINKLLMNYRKAAEYYFIAKDKSKYQDSYLIDWINFNLGNLHYEIEDFTSALKYYNLIDEDSNIDSNSIYLAQLQCYYNTFNKSKFDSILNKINNSSRFYNDALLLKAHFQNDLELIDEARNTYLELFESDSSNLDYQFGLLKSYSIDQRTKIEYSEFRNHILSKNDLAIIDVNLEKLIYAEHLIMRNKHRDAEKILIPLKDYYKSMLLSKRYLETLKLLNRISYKSSIEKEMDSIYYAKLHLITDLNLAVNNLEKNIEIQELNHIYEKKIFITVIVALLIISVLVIYSYKTRVQKIKAELVKLTYLNTINEFNTNLNQDVTEQFMELQYHVLEMDYHKIDPEFNELFSNFTNKLNQLKRIKQDI